MDMSGYMELFFEESREHLQAINQTLLELEQSGSDLDLVSTVFRSAHTLKGMSATMGFENMAHMTHEMENALDLMRSAKLTVTSDVMDLLFQCVDLLEAMLQQISESGTDSSVSVEQVLSKLQALVNGSASGSNSLEKPHMHEVAKANQFEHLSFNQYEASILQQALEMGLTAYQVEVTLANSCVLKAARAYLIMQALEGAGEVLRATPSVEELELEHFEQGFGVILLSSLSAAEIEAAVLKISEVVHCQADQIKDVTGSQYAAHADAELAAARTAELDSPPVHAEGQQPGRQEKTPGFGRKSMSSKSVRVDIERLDALMNRFSELVIDRTRLEQISHKLAHTELIETVEQMSRISGELQTIVMAIRMVQVETVFNRFPRMVRDLAKDLNKQVDFVMNGVETELDRTIVDEIGDPLVHMLRNSLDHALETPTERAAAGKSETGRLELNAYHSGNHVFIEVIDDGRGIDRQKVLNRAVERNLIEPHQADAMPDQAVFDLLFRSGFSTAEKVSDLSGRGVGLDVVKSKIESIGGRVQIQSALGQGTKFTIQLPLTLSIIQALMIQIADEKYAVPLSSILEAARIGRSSIRSVHKQEVIDFRGKLVPLLDLSKLFSVPRLVPESDSDCCVVVVHKGEKMAGLIVDSFLGQQEVVLKSLGSYLSGFLFAISGATILGDGEVALILDCNALIN